MIIKNTQNANGIVIKLEKYRISKKHPLLYTYIFKIKGSRKWKFPDYFKSRVYLTTKIFRLKY